MSFRSLLVTGDDTVSVLARCRDALADLRADTDGGYDLGLVYLSDHLAGDAAGIVESLRQLTGVAQWAGGVALGVCGREGEAFDRPALSLLLARLPADGYRVFGPTADPAADPALARWREAHAPYLGLVHADPREPAVPLLVARMGSGLGPYLVGGLLSSRGEYPQVGEAVGEGALSGVLFTSRVAAVTRLSQGCSPIGERRTVTRAQGNRIYALDGAPALAALAADVDASGGSHDVHIARLRPESDTGDYLVRNILGTTPQREGLVVGDAFAEGDAVMFCRRDAASAEADLRRMVDALAGALPGPPRAGIYVSCLARGPNLFAEPGLETRLIRERLGEALPLAGFFANGEIAGDRLYGYTGVLTVFC